MTLNEVLHLILDGIHVAEDVRAEAHASVDAELPKAPEGA